MPLRGGLSSFFDVQSALSMFEQRYRQLDGPLERQNEGHKPRGTSDESLGWHVLHITFAGKK